MQVAERITRQTDTSHASVVVLCAEESIRDVIAYWLSSLPGRALVAQDGYQANRLLTKNNCGLLVTDRILPPWPGLETFVQLRSAHPHLRIAFVDDGSRDARILARVTGAHLVLERPLTRQAILGALPAVAAGA